MSYPTPNDNKREPPPLSLTLPSKRFCPDPRFKNEPAFAQDRLPPLPPLPSHPAPTASPNAFAPAPMHDFDQIHPDSPAVAQDSAPDHPDLFDPSVHGSPAAPLAPAPGPDKFTKSRAVGQSHRDNEKEHVLALQKDVEDCRVENILLFAVFASQYKAERNHKVTNQVTIGAPSTGQVRLEVETDRPEDCDINSDEEARARGLHKLSPETASWLGQEYMSSTMAQVLVEMLGYRRNIIVDSPDPTRRRRRRGSFRNPTATEQANSVFEHGFDLFMAESAGMSHEAQCDYVQEKLGALSLLVRRWSILENMRNPANFDDQEGEEVGQSPPGSPTRPEAAEFGSPNRRRGDGAKRCSRCCMIKRTGSGHGRSKCDDGLSISSPVPYPAPSSEGQHSS